MIQCTTSASPMLRKVFNKDEISTSAIPAMAKQICIDPETTSQKIDAYILTAEDLKFPKVANVFYDALRSKHPKSKIIIIQTKKKSTLPVDENGGIPGVDVILIMPKPNQIQEVISEIINRDTVSKVAYETANVYNNDVHVDNTQFTPQPEFQEEVAAPAPEINVEATPVDIPTPPPVEEVKPEPAPVNKESELVQRIKEAGSILETSQISREIKATTLVKELIEENKTYADIEDKIAMLNIQIHDIMNDPNIPSIEEKLTKVRALTQDRSAWSSKTDSILEQRLEEIISAITTTTAKHVEARLAEIDNAIEHIHKQEQIANQNTRLGGLTEERSNVILELRTLEAEVNRIYKSCDELTTDTVMKISKDNGNSTGSEFVDMHLRARGSNIISEESLTAIRAAIEMSATETPEQFKALKRSVIEMQKKLVQLYDLDAETIAAYQATIDYMKMNRIEDSVVAETLLKKSLRMFIGNEGNGRSIIPYLLSYYKSKQNANVLLFDITGQGKYSDYGITTISIDDYINNPIQSEFVVVSGDAMDTAETAERLLKTLIKSADYYRVINIVARPDQRGIINAIAPDILCINFITSSAKAELANTREYFKEFTFENVAKRLLINKCDVETAPIIKFMGLEDSLDYAINTIPTIKEITDASLKCYNPYGCSNVALLIQETLKYC